MSLYAAATDRGVWTRALLLRQHTRDTVKGLVQVKKRGGALEGKWKTRNLSNDPAARALACFQPPPRRWRVPQGDCLPPLGPPPLRRQPGLKELTISLARPCSVRPISCWCTKPLRVGAERGGLARFYTRSPHLAHHKYCQRPESCTEKSSIREANILLNSLALSGSV